MRTLFKWIIVLAVLGGLGFAAYRPAMAWWKERNKVTFRTEKVSVGDLAAYVNSTGEIKPVQSVKVGAFVSGPITSLLVDFNDRVEKGQLLAEIDPRLPSAAVQREKASLATRRASVEQVQAQLQQARNDEKRAEELRAENRDFLSQAEFDRLHFARLGLEAQLEVAEAQVEQAEASLQDAEANLAYTKIESPVDGMIIDRKVDEGQTVASGFQTPELFTIAPRMEEVMHVFASVDEADIGLIREAQEQNRDVKFTVDAYPDEEFIGKVEQIRLSSTQIQNVVTYPVVVAAPNPDLKLLPGMTADLSFLIEEKADVLRVPNAALRFFPDKKHVRPEDHKILSGDATTKKDKDDDQSDESKSADVDDSDATSSDETDEGSGDGGDDDGTENGGSKSKKKAKDREGRIRHVWVKDGEKLRAIEIRTGLSDSEYTEVLEDKSGELEDGQELVVGIN